MKFGKQNIKLLRDDIEDALKKLQEKHSVLMQLGNITFMDSKFTSRLNGILIENFKLVHDTKAEIGMKILFQSKIYEIIELRNQRYPIIIKDVESGKKYKLSEAQFRLSVLIL